MQELSLKWMMNNWGKGINCILGDEVIPQYYNTFSLCSVPATAVTAVLHLCFTGPSWVCRLQPLLFDVRQFRRNSPQIMYACNSGNCAGQLYAIWVLELLCIPYHRIIRMPI